MLCYKPYLTFFTDLETKHVATKFTKRSHRKLNLQCKVTSLPFLGLALNPLVSYFKLNHMRSKFLHCSLTSGEVLC